jgi:hypothetical protein
MKKDSEKTKKIRIKLYLWILLPLVLAFLAFVLLTHKPNDYTPLRITDQNQISLYLTHNMLPVIYNNLQLDKPFEIVITEEGLNDIIARWRQPMSYDNISFTDPQVIFEQNQIILMATANTEIASPVLTIRVTPAINSFGLLNIHVDSISLGAAGITTLAKSMGSKALSDWLAFTGMEPNDIVILACRSLLNDEPFDPVFKVGDKSLRLCKIKLEKNKITALLLPLPDTSSSRSRNKTD